MSEPAGKPFALSIPEKRMAGLDMARAFALVAMAIFHFTWDLEFFGYIAPGTTSLFGWKLFARAIAGSFLFLAGVSLYLAHDPVFRGKAFARRLALIVAAAMAISVATFVSMPDSFIFFGILHSIAAASLVGLMFLRAPVAVMLIASALAFSAPLLIRSEIFDAPWLWWVGLSTIALSSNDYVPLLPWLAPFLLGMAGGKLAKGRKTLERLEARIDRTNWFVRAFSFGGRHSLAIYLLHQPILIGAVWLASQVSPPTPDRFVLTDPVAGYISGCEQACAANGNSAAMCTRFCACTMDELLSRELFNAVQSGRMDLAEDEQIQSIARSCTMSALSETTAPNTPNLK